MHSKAWKLDQTISKFLFWMTFKFWYIEHIEHALYIEQGYRTDRTRLKIIYRVPTIARSIYYRGGGVNFLQQIFGNETSIIFIIFLISRIQQIFWKQHYCSNLPYVRYQQKSAFFKIQKCTAFLVESLRSPLLRAVLRAYPARTLG